MRLLVAAMAMSFACAPVAAAQKAPAQKVQTAAPNLVVTYEDALVCYAYYVAVEEMSRKLEDRELSNADLAAGFELAALEADRMKGQWAVRVKDLAAKRQPAQIETDLKRAGGPVIADANAALAGDKAARGRGEHRGVSCAAHTFAPSAR